MNAPTAPKPKKFHGPEAAEWDRLKGGLVDVLVVTGDVFSGKLVWIDFYTIGVDTGIGGVGRRRIIYKGNIVAAGPKDDEG